MKFFDFDMNNPIIVSSGPFTQNKESIRRILSYNPGAIVTKTISIEKQNEKHGIIKEAGYFYNKEGYSDKRLEYWENVFGTFSKQNVIASISGTKIESICYLAKFCEKCGVKMIELCLSCPTVGVDPICMNLERLEAICDSVRRKVDIPISVKVLASMSKTVNINMVEILKNSGMDAVSVSDTLPALRYDRQGVAENGGISGAFLKAIVLKFLQDVKDISICKIGIGGIETGKDVMDYLKSGCSAVGICSVLIDKGDKYLTELVKETQESRSEMDQ